MRHLLCGVFCLATLVTSAQYRYDNDKYTTVYPQDLCATLKAHPGLIVDVRTKGEFDDTAANKVQNMGHMAGAQNIDLRELATRWREISEHKDQPVYVYCASSQRSRRAARLLADSGFTQVYNINGGMSFFRAQGFTDLCPETALHTSLKYKLVAPLQLAHQKGKILYTVIDVRSDSAFKGLTADPHKRALGRLAFARNIPLATFSTAGIDLPKDIPVLLVDDNGAESVKAADWLLAHGYRDVSVLFSGMYGWVSELPSQNRLAWSTPVPYELINAGTFADRARHKWKPAVIDVRTAAEFSNTTKDATRNIGHIKGALNIPAPEIEARLSSLALKKTAPIVVYGYANEPEVFRAAQALTDAGYQDVSVMMGGLFNLRWRAANLKGFDHLGSWVVNVPPANQ